MMKKMLFLLLFLVIIGTVGTNAQVRIGGNGVPNGAAVLDLNATDVINTGTKGLALPRVTLGSNTAQLTTGVSNLSGMLIYNTGGSLGAGIYYWNGSQWQPIMNGALAEQDSVIGNEVVNATTGRGLVRAGDGTTASPYTLGIADNGIITSMITDKAVLPGKIGSAAEDAGRFLMSNGSGAAFVPLYSNVYTDTMVINAGALGQITWSLVLDTTVPLRGLANSVNRFTATGIRVNDMCRQSTNYHPIHMWAYNNWIYWLSVSASAVTLTERIRCYRPSL